MLLVEVPGNSQVRCNIFCGQWDNDHMCGLEQQELILPRLEAGAHSPRGAGSLLPLSAPGSCWHPRLWPVTLSPASACAPPLLPPPLPPLSEHLTLGSPGRPQLHTLDYMRRPANELTVTGSGGVNRFCGVWGPHLTPSVIIYEKPESVWHQWCPEISAVLY